MTTNLEAPHFDKERILNTVKDRVIAAATNMVGDPEHALKWYQGASLPGFEYKSPQEVVAEGKGEDLIRIVKSLCAGAGLVADLAPGIRTP